MENYKKILVDSIKSKFPEEVIREIDIANAIFSGICETPSGLFIQYDLNEDVIYCGSISFGSLSDYGVSREMTMATAAVVPIITNKFYDYYIKKIDGLITPVPSNRYMGEKCVLTPKQVKEILEKKGDSLNNLEEAIFSNNET